jgi:hypothetical protein
MLRSQIRGKRLRFLDARVRLSPPALVGRQRLRLMGLGRVLARVEVGQRLPVGDGRRSRRYLVDAPGRRAWSASRCDRHMTRGSTTQKHETRRMRAGVSSKAGEDSSLAHRRHRSDKRIASAVPGLSMPGVSMKAKSRRPGAPKRSPAATSCVTRQGRRGTADRHEHRAAARAAWEGVSGSRRDVIRVSL